MLVGEIGSFDVVELLFRLLEGVFQGVFPVEEFRDGFEDIFSLVRVKRVRTFFVSTSTISTRAAGAFFYNHSIQKQRTFFLRDSLRLTCDLFGALSRAFLDVLSLRVKAKCQPTRGA